MRDNLLWSIAILLSCTLAHSQNPTDLPLFQIGQLSYHGAFRLPAQTFGSSSLNYSEGAIAYNSDRHSIFIVGHSHHQAIAEFAIPDLVNSETLDDLNMAGSPLQEFVTILDRTDDGNPQNLNRVGGLQYLSGDPAVLIVNAFEYYDAPGDNSQSTLMIRNCSDLANSAVDGFMRFEGGAGHTSGWISPIPTNWQSSLGGTHITGQSSGQPIISRFSVGPSAFSFDIEALLSGNSEPVPTTKLLDFSLQNPLHQDLSNSDLSNKLWTHLSRATYGFVIPGTRSYLTIGYSGGHESGVCYKCTQDNGNLCGGYCPPIAADRYQFYWLWDLQDLLAVKEETMVAHEVRPYDSGELKTPFQNGTQQIGGASFDPDSGLLYLSIQKADRSQGTYSNPPIILAYQFDQTSSTESVNAFEGSSIFPNPTTKMLNIRTQESSYDLRIFDSRARLQLQVSVRNPDLSIDLSQLPKGLYLLDFRNEKGERHYKKLLKL